MMLATLPTPARRSGGLTPRGLAVALTYRLRQAVETLPPTESAALLEGAEQWLKIRRKGDGAKFYVAKVQAERRMGRSRPSDPAEPLPCTGCHNYHRTDAERLQAHPDARRDLAPGGAAHLQVLRAAGAWAS